MQITNYRSQRVRQGELIKKYTVINLHLPRLFCIFGESGQTH